jgi:hypothetical protein
MDPEHATTLMIEWKIFQSCAVFRANGKRCQCREMQGAASQIENKRTNGKGFGVTGLISDPHGAVTPYPGPQEEVQNFPLRD